MVLVVSFVDRSASNVVCTWQASEREDSVVRVEHEVAGSYLDNGHECGRFAGIKAVLLAKPVRGGVVRSLSPLREISSHAAAEAMGSGRRSTHAKQ